MRACRCSHLLAGLVLAGLSAPSEARAEATVLVTPGIAAPGDVVTVTARGLPRRTRGRLVVRSDGLVNLRRLRTSAGGTVRTRLDVPQTGSRRATLELRVGRARVVYRMPVTRALSSPSSLAHVAASGRRLFLRPAVARALQDMRLTGAGFRRRDRVRVAVGTVPAATSRVTRRGRFGATFTAPASGPRTTSVSVRVGRTRTRLPFRVLAAGTPGQPDPVGPTEPPDGDEPGAPPAPQPPREIVVPPGLRDAQDPVLVAVGDIACRPGETVTATSCRQQSTADVARAIAPEAVALLGDIQYEDGRYADFVSSFDVAWGSLKALMRPTPGNHEYVNNSAPGYFDYFGLAAGDRKKGYYSYDLGAWHVVVLNTNFDCKVVACGAGSAQEQWLREDLAAHSNACVLAYWHHPLFTNGDHHRSEAPRALWQALHDHGAEVVLTGHEHSYERFAPMDAHGVPDAARGLRSFVVGTGGKSLFPAPAETLQPTTEVRDDKTFGVLGMVLRPTGYDWYFVPEAAGDFVDQGSAACH